VADQIETGPMTGTALVRRRASAHRPGAELGRLTLQVPGRHNLLNALSAVAVGLELGLSFAAIAAGLGEFKGAERRFEVRGEVNGVLVVDDYGHHPTEIRAVLAAARTLNRRIVVVFQPHRFSRTAALLSEFGAAFVGAARVIVTDIYAAGEDPLPGITSDALAAVIRDGSSVPVDVVPRLDDVPAVVAGVADRGDIVLTLGAGSIGTLPERLLQTLEAGR
jgi:UDP-N-acetylmuramate--alanine ligase